MKISVLLYPQQMQLQLEYAPQPPFECGRLELAGEALVTQVRGSLDRQVVALAAAS